MPVVVGADDGGGVLGELGSAAGDRVRFVGRAEHADVVDLIPEHHQTRILGILPGPMKPPHALVPEAVGGVVDDDRQRQPQTANSGADQEAASSASHGDAQPLAMQAGAGAAGTETQR